MIGNGVADKERLCEDEGVDVVVPTDVGEDGDKLCEGKAGSKRLLDDKTVAVGLGEATVEETGALTDDELLDDVFGV